jgi:hypothetical protein
MKNSNINQELESIINLMGEQVSFVRNVKHRDEFLSQKVEGQVTDIVLNLDGNHQVSVEGGDFFIFSELVDFKVLDAK